MLWFDGSRDNRIWTRPRPVGDDREDVYLGVFALGLREAVRSGEEEGKMEEN